MSDGLNVWFEDVITILLGQCSMTAFGMLVTNGTILLNSFLSTASLANRRYRI